MSWYRYQPYVSVAERREKAGKKMAKLRKKGQSIEPVEIEGRTIAKSFWGKSWCEHLETFSDYDNRLPRGRSYVRNGSVCHLAIAKGKVKAMVMGSSLYNVEVTIKNLKKDKWKRIKQRSVGQIGSLLELLQGKLSHDVMKVVADEKDGLFPLSREISFSCSCPDWAVMCKHVAAVLYGIGARLDEQPELLFLLRGVDHGELISADIVEAVSSATTRGKGTSKRLAANDLSDVFDISLDTDEIEYLAPAKGVRSRRAKKTANATKVTGKKKAVGKGTKAKKKTAKKQQRTKKR